MLRSLVTLSSSSLHLFAQVMMQQRNGELVLDSLPHSPGTLRRIQRPVPACSTGVCQPKAQMEAIPFMGKYSVSARYGENRSIFSYFTIRDEPCCFFIIENFPR